MDAVSKVSFMELQNIWRLTTSGMLRLVDWQIFTDVSKERSANQAALLDQEAEGMRQVVYVMETKNFSCA